MGNIVQLLKKIGLFLFGVALIIWGYKANATNKTESAKVDETPKKEADIAESITQKEQEQEKEEEAEKPKPKVKVLSNTDVKKTETKKAEVKSEEKKKPKETPEVSEPTKPVVEKATPEESSGTE